MLKGYVPDFFFEPLPNDLIEKQENNEKSIPKKVEQKQIQLIRARPVRTIKTTEKDEITDKNKPETGRRNRNKAPVYLEESS